jgi:hypothetical protein
MVAPANGINAGKIIRLAVIEDPGITNAAIKAKLDERGLTVKAITIQTLRADTKVLLRILLAKGLLGEPAASALRCADAAVGVVVIPESEAAAVSE